MRSFPRSVLPSAVVLDRESTTMRRHPIPIGRHKIRILPFSYSLALRRSPIIVPITCWRTPLLPTNHRSAMRPSPVKVWPLQPRSSSHLELFELLCWYIVSWNMTNHKKTQSVNVVQLMEGVTFLSRIYMRNLWILLIFWSFWSSPLLSFC
jgi:hypothetical protein